MSAFETFIWYFLGYSSVPFVFFMGFVVTAIVACVLLDVMGFGPDSS